METTRSDEIRTALVHHDELRGFEVAEQHHPAWLEQHPSGFGSVCRLEEGEVFFFNPDRIVSTVAGYDDTAFTLYVDAILDWWTASVLILSSGFAVDTAMLNFATNFPDSYGWFAGHADILSSRFSLTDWLAPEWRTT